MSARENYLTRERQNAVGRENFSLSPPRLAFLAWGDFHARSTIPEEKWELLVV